MSEIKPVNYIFVEELLGEKVNHNNSHLGRGLIVNALYAEYENSPGKILIDIEFSADKIRSEIDVLEYLKLGIISFENEDITLEYLDVLSYDIQRWIEEGEKERELELQKLENNANTSTDSSKICKKNSEVYHYLTKNRKVEQLVHFTPINNLIDILEKGIVPRNSVSGSAICLDPERRDKMTDCNCISITSPNWAMFYKYRINNPNLIFAVLILDPALLLSKEYDDVLFMQNNAASSKYDGIREIRKGVEYAKTMFNDSFFQGEKNNYRNSVGLQDNETTDAQAEILVRGVIDKKYIKKIYIQSERELDEAKTILPNEIADIMEVNDTVFRQRRDWKLSKRRY